MASDFIRWEFQFDPRRIQTVEKCITIKYRLFGALNDSFAISFSIGPNERGLNEPP